MEHETRALKPPTVQEEIQDECSVLIKTRRRDSHYGCIPVSSEESTAEFLCYDNRSDASDYLYPEEILKRRLKYFFMNPLKKWQTKGKFPFKLVLQIVKIVFVTIQLCVFGSDGYIYELQKQHTSSSFRHIFLLDWTPIREVASYPPSTGPYAVYTKPEFYDNVDHIVKRYFTIKSLALGTYSYTGPPNQTGLNFCRDEFKMILVVNSTLKFDNRVNTVCHFIPELHPPEDPSWNNFTMKEFLETNNDTIHFDRLISATLSFSLNTLFLKSLANIKFPDCYRFNIDVNYDNTEHDGQMLVNLNTNTKKLTCHHNSDINSNSTWGYVIRQILNCFIIVISLLSLLLCCRCLVKAYILCNATNRYLVGKHSKQLTANEKLEFVDAWYCMMIINDLLIITGSILKACIEQRTVESDQYATCAILLGTGNLLVWAGVLRYLGFFRKYNILILTLKRALPNVLRFMLCCILLYAGFCFCGWVVLGPYHIKFRSLSTTSECLFAMMNGDDLFATFAITNTNNNLIWWFSRIYLYVFISMFIYVVISLFISVIMDSYETVKDYYQHGGALSRIQSIIADYPDDSCSSFYQQRRVQQDSMWVKLFRFCSRNN